MQTKLIENYKSLTMPKIMAFDLDLTIHDIITLYEKIVNDTRLFMGKRPWTDEDFRECHKTGWVSTKEVFAKMFPGKSDIAIQFYYDRYHEITIPKHSLMPGASFMLHRIRKLYHLKIIGVTNSEQHMAKKALRDLGIFHLFDSITGPKGNRKLKPETELLIIGLNKIGAEPGKNVWFMGDSATDTLCAKDANCTSIRFYTGEKPEDPNADIFCNSHFEFEEIIASLHQNNSNKIANIA